MSNFSCDVFSSFNIVPTTIFDVGAHDPFDLPKIIHSTYRDCMIFQFEASPTVFNMYYNKEYSNIKAFNFAISSIDNKFVQFYESDRLNVNENGDGGWVHTYSGSILEPIRKRQFASYKLTFKDAPISVLSRTIFSFCLEHGIGNIDLLHVDVQGAETEVIAGLGEIRPSLIFAEVCEFDKYESKTNRENFINFLHNFGYEIASDLGSDILFHYRSNK